MCAPDDRRFRVSPEQRDHLLEVRRLGAGLRKRHVHVVVEDHDEACFTREVENPVHRWIR